MADSGCYISNELLKISHEVIQSEKQHVLLLGSKHSPSVFLPPAGCVLTFDEVTSRNFASLQSSCQSSCDMHRVLQQATERFRQQRRNLLLGGGRRGRTALGPSATVPQSRTSCRRLTLEHFQMQAGVHVTLPYVNPVCSPSSTQSGKKDSKVFNSET